jgi:hypothetical protein
LRQNQLFFGKEKKGVENFVFPVVRTSGLHPERVQDQQEWFRQSLDWKEVTSDTHICKKHCTELNTLFEIK